MKKNIINEVDIINGIKSGGVEQEKCIRYIYDNCFPFVFKALKQHKISRELAIDAYTDAVMSLRRHIVNGSFRGDSKYSTFLYRIFFNKCLNAIRDSGTNKLEYEYELPLHLQDKAPRIAKLLEVKEQFGLLQSYMEQLGEKCKEVLMDAIYFGYKMEEIAHRHGYKDSGTVRSKKHTCLQQLKKKIAEAGEWSPV